MLAGMTNSQIEDEIADAWIQSMRLCAKARLYEACAQTIAQSFHP